MKLTELEDMVVLGLLKGGPLHGYHIRKIIKERFGYFTGFSPYGIYYSLKKLQKKQFLTEKKERVGARPEREMYSITEKGAKEFERMMEKNLNELYRPFFNIDLALYFSEHVDPGFLKEKVARQALMLREIRIWAKKEGRKHKPPYSLILEHIDRAVTCEIEFLNDLLK